MEDRRNSGIDGSDQKTGHAQQESDDELFSYLNYPTARKYMYIVYKLLKTNGPVPIF